MRGARLMRRILGDWLQPRACSLDPIVRGATEIVPFKIFNVPAGVTVSEVRWSVKVALTDLDAARRIAKSVTTAPSPTQGRITQAAGGSAIEGYFQLVTTDTPDSLPTRLLHDVWVFCSDGSQRQVAAPGDITVVQPVTSGVIYGDTVPAYVTVSPNPASASDVGTLQMTKVVENSGHIVIPGAVVTWTSSDPTKATVNSSTGLVTAVAEGTTTIRATSTVPGIYGESVLSVQGLIAGLVSGFAADDPTGASYMLIGYDTKYGSTPPTLGAGNAFIRTLPVAYRRAGVPDLPLQSGRGSDLAPVGTDWVGWDNTLKEIVITTAWGDMWSALDQIFNLSQAAWTVWYIASTPHPSGAGTTPAMPLLSIDDRVGTGGPSPTLGKAQLLYLNGNTDVGLSAQIAGTNTAVVTKNELDTTSTELRLSCFGYDPATKDEWIGVEGDVWQQATQSAFNGFPNIAMRIVLLGNNRGPARVRGLWVSRGKPTPLEVARLQSFAKVSHGAASKTASRLKIFGNSHISGTGASDDAHSFAGLMRANAAGGTDCLVLGHAGANWSSLSTSAVSELDYAINADRSIEDVLIHEWANSSTGDATADYNQFLAFYAPRIAAGTYRKIWVTTMWPKSTTTQVYLDAINTLIVAGAATHGYLVQNNTNLAMALQANLATWFPDGLHPGDPGYLAWYNNAVAQGVPLAGTGPTVYLSHTFSGGPSAVSVGTADTGQTPIVLGLATWGVDANGRAYVAVTGADGAVVFETGHADGTLSAVAAVMDPSSAGWRLCARATNKDNLIELIALDASTYSLYKLVAGAPTQIGTWTTVAPATGQTPTLVMLDDQITVKIGATTLGTVTETFNKTATKHGFVSDSTSTNRFDTLLFTS